MTKWQYTKGLQDLGNNSYAWLQPDEARKRCDAGMSDAEAARIIVNIHTLYKDFGAPRKADALDYHAWWLSCVSIILFENKYLHERPL